MNDNVKPLRKVTLKNVRKYFREYCGATSIHGFRYFGENRTICEKLWWVITFIFCLLGCIFSIIQVYKKWENCPVIVTFATKPIPMYKIPFPAVTICSQSKINPKLFDITEALRKKEDNKTLSKKEEKILNYAAAVCNYNSIIEYRNFSNTDDYFEIMEEISPTFKIMNCLYLGIPNNCDDLFIPVITDEGLCYTFNILDRNDIFNENVVHYSNFHQVNTSAKEWNIEKGYSDHAKIMTYPRRALLSGYRYSLKFELKTMKDETDNICRQSVQGYKVSLHIPIRVARPSEQFFRIPHNQDVVAAIRPSAITTSDSVKNYNPKSRECYFPSERTLKFYKIYSQINCKMECVTNSTLATCNCVDFFMPRENGTKICGGNDWKCLILNEYNTQAADLLKNLEHEPLDPSEMPKDCDCMPICTDIDYNAEISQTDWKWTKRIVNIDNTSSTNLSDYYMSRCSIYFKSSEFIGSERNELYGPTDFLANFGGLLGLFTGFSVLSLMEIIYYLTIRLICNTRLYGTWSGPE